MELERDLRTVGQSIESDVVSRAVEEYHAKQNLRTRLYLGVIATYAIVALEDAESL